MRCPFTDQPGAGVNVRAVTGPHASAQTVVEPWGGSVEWLTTAGPIADEIPLIAAAPPVRPTPSHPFALENASDLTPFDLDPGFVCGLGQGIQAPLRRGLLVSRFQA